MAPDTEHENTMLMGRLLAINRAAHPGWLGQLRLGAAS